jgi:hypothetical protein
MVERIEESPSPLCGTVMRGGEIPVIAIISQERAETPFWSFCAWLGHKVR